MRIVGPVYRWGHDSRIDSASWIMIPTVPALLEYQYTQRIGRADLSWDGDLLVCSLPIRRPVTSGDYESWGLLNLHRYLAFGYRFLPAVEPDTSRGIRITCVALTRKPYDDDLPPWILED